MVWRFVIFLRVGTSFGWLEKTLQTTSKESKQYTHKYSTCRVAQHANTRGSRAGRLRIAHLCVQKQLSSTCHVSSLAAPDTVHNHKFSLTCCTYLSDDPTNTQTFGTRWIFTLRCSTPEWRINTNPISQTIYPLGLLKNKRRWSHAALRSLRSPWSLRSLWSCGPCDPCDLRLNFCGCLFNFFMIIIR